MNGRRAKSVKTIAEIGKMTDPQLAVMEHLKRLGFKVVDVRNETKPTALVSRCRNGEEVTIILSGDKWPHADAEGVAYCLEELADGATLWAIRKLLADYEESDE